MIQTVYHATPPRTGQPCLRSPIIFLYVAMCVRRATSEDVAILRADRPYERPSRNALKTAGFGPLARANHAGCLEQCEHGPTVVIYPQGIWYGGVKIEDVPRIVEKTILGGEILNDLVIADVCLNNPDCPHRADATGRESRG